MNRNCYICGKPGKVRGTDENMQNIYLCDIHWNELKDKQGQTVRLERDDE